MTKYYKVTGILHEDEYEFVLRVARLFGCSLAKALSVCVIWARQNKSFQELLKRIEDEIGSTGSKEVNEHGVG